MRGKRTDNKEQQERPEQPEQPGQPEASPPPGTRGGSDLEPKRITPVEIQQKEFRMAFHGYNERDVDAFLDEVTEEVGRLHAENKRLREDMGARGTTRIDTGAAAEADVIVREAREEAARIVAEAESKGAAAASAAAQRIAGPGSFASSRNFINAFLGRERDFLQGLAGLIQSHAESVKEDIRVSRDQARGGTRPPAPGPSGAPTPAPTTVGSAPGEGSAAERSGTPGGVMASDERHTQPWRPADLGPEATRPGSGSTGTTSPDQQSRGMGVATGTIAPESPPGQRQEPEGGGAVLDLTKIDEEPSPPASPSLEDVAKREDVKDTASNEEQSSDRSLRELFWGED
jgi:DivIVA domain-containing protein